VLTASGSTGAVFLAQVQADGSILIRPTGQVTVAPAKDLELWALSKGATIPVSLGVLPADGRLVRAQAQDHRPDTQLLISLEPKGGSPSGLPTGPVVYGGKLDPWR
jgi:anti-sigma-K factor RskA